MAGTSPTRTSRGLALTALVVAIAVSAALAWNFVRENEKVHVYVVWEVVPLNDSAPYSVFLPALLDGGSGEASGATIYPSESISSYVYEPTERGTVLNLSAKGSAGATMGFETTRQGYRDHVRLSTWATQEGQPHGVLGVRAVSAAPTVLGIRVTATAEMSGAGCGAYDRFAEMVPADGQWHATLWTEGETACL